MAYNFRIERFLGPGTFYARVGFFGGGVGTYTVHAAVAPLDDTDLFELVDGRGSGVLDEPGDVDTWRFEVAAAGKMVAETTGDTDMFGELDDGVGRVLQTNDDSGEGRNFRIERDLAAGTYFLRVRGFGNAAGAYGLRVYPLPVEEGEGDVGDSRAAAGALAMDEAQDSVISPAGDVDYWRVEVPSRGTLVAESEGGTDTQGALEDAEGTTLARDDDGAGDDRNRNFRIERQVAPGIYFVRVGGFDTRTGEYSIRASHTRDELSIPWLLAAQEVAGTRQGFVRLVNRSDRPGTVSIEAIDDAGASAGTIDLALSPGQAVHFNSNDLENGNAAKGIVAGVGAGQGDWRLRLAADSADLDLNVLSYVRTGRGFLTGMHDLVPPQAAHGDFGHRYVVPIFNPASNRRQVSKLRLFNPDRADRGGDHRGGGRRRRAGAGRGSSVRVEGPGRRACWEAQELEEGGDGPARQLGQRRWQVGAGGRFEPAARRDESHGDAARRAWRRGGRQLDQPFYSRPRIRRRAARPQLHAVALRSAVLPRGRPPAAAGFRAHRQLLHAQRHGGDSRPGRQWRRYGR